LCSRANLGGKKKRLVASRKPSLKVVQRNEEVLERIKQLKADHPFWGYRRIWAYLHHAEHRLVNKKRIYRLMKEDNLLVDKNTRLKAKRTSKTKKPKPDKPNQWWGIDMTKVLTLVGWVYITIVLDWYTKKVVGYHMGVQSKACHWLEALHTGVNQQFPQGVRGQGLKLMSDNGSQPTATMFLAECGQMGIEQAFTAYSNPKGNADTERFMRTMKEECLWLQEWTSPKHVESEVSQWINQYNTEYLHSTLGYMPPEQFEKRYHATLLKSA
jgi:transposase InsO family protein